MSSVETKVEAIAVAPRTQEQGDSRAKGLWSVEGKTFASMVIAHVFVDCYGGMWPIFKMLAGLDLAKAGLISTATTLLTMPLQPLFGIWADQGRRRLFVLVGMAMSSLGMLLGMISIYQQALGEATSYAMMFLVMLVLRLGHAIFHPAGTGVAGNVAASRRSMFVAVFISGGMIGFAASQMLFAWAYHTFDGHTELMLLPAMAAFMLVFAWCRPVDTRTGERPRLRDVAASLSVLKSRLFALFLILALASAQATGLYFLLPEFIASRGYPSWMVHGGGFGFLVAGSVALMIPAGHIADRFGMKRTLTAVLVGALASYYLLILTPAMPLPLFALLCFVAGGLLGTSNPLGVAMAQHLLPRRTSLISGVMMGLAWALGSFGPVMVGVLADITTFGIDGALAILGVTNVIAIVLMIPLRKVTVDES